MYALVIYDSTFGNTQQIAQIIARVLGEHVPVQISPVEEVSTSELKKADVLVLGCPTQNYDLTPDVRAFLETLPERIVGDLMAAAFDTRYRTSAWSTGSAAWSIARQLQEAGVSLILPPESFFVAAKEGPLEDGELERAAQWAKTLFERFDSWYQHRRECAKSQLS